MKSVLKQIWTKPTSEYLQQIQSSSQRQILQSCQHSQTIFGDFLCHNYQVNCQHILFLMEASEKRKKL